MKYTSLTMVAMMAIGLPLVGQTAPTAAQMAQQMVQRYAVVLGLSSTQEEQALTIYTAEATTEATVRTSEQAARAELVIAIEADNATTITSLSATLGELEGQSVLAKSTADATFYALLTTEQQAKFAQALEQGPGGPGGAPRR